MFNPTASFFIFVVFTASSINTTLCRADDVDNASTAALAKTQQMLEDPVLRNKAIGESASAQTVDAQVKALAGNSQSTEELYKLSGAVLEDLVKETGGDAAKMMQIVTKAMSNPRDFESHLSEKNKAAIHDISTKIENAPTTRQPAAQLSQ